MPKNVVIFSDGTGQVGGINFDEDRTNIYKMYRACRVAPDSAISPAEQVAFYDPGLGSVADGGPLLSRMGRWIYNKISQATGLGVTANIIDGYAALIRLCRPGDKVYLFGFSRGAYTVRCLASVIGMCGIPQKDGDDKLRLDVQTSRRIARRAVKSVYQYTHSIRRDYASKRQNELMDQRLALAKQFREHFASSDKSDSNRANVYPHFIGVFDTVSAIATPGARKILIGACVILAALLAIPVSWFFDGGLLLSFALIVVGAGAAAGAVFLLKSIRCPKDLPGHPWHRTFHFVQFKQQFRDFDLNENAGYARHAIAIDENRADFARVPWGFNDPKHDGKDASGNPWFQQLWFAGNHADIGGGYPENESRLSDCALEWMVQEARKVGLHADDSVLRLHASCDGMQHDEVAAGFGLATRLFGRTWKKGLRQIPSGNTTVHPSVYKRFQCADVLLYDLLGPYRPAALEAHEDFGWWYLTTAPAAAPMATPTAAPDPKAPPPTKEQPGP